ncbi:ABC transporter substrate-binding protein [Microbacterium marinilacus]|uniref:ABC transporter substrate-binding protein n=1 Tax=Microbacterium marinilacus TaxID=415209 RepID=A0ABP7BPE2_9MICO|nr:ABC transporter substrate-binding protein [Microbacterium marinilacus]MBY0690250.1 ABC transporter substrate-binding protein [Microbacterium marinilacus]
MSTSRRRLAAAAMLTAAGTALAGCAGGEAPGDAASATPASGGSATFAVSTTFGSFDPNITASAPDARAIRQVFDSLVDLDADGEIVPWLASAWEVSDDGLAYTFTLRDDVSFHDGTAFDAEAVCYNLDRIVAPETASLYAISLIGPYESCEAPDATTAVVTLSAPYTPLLANLSTPFLGIVSPTAAEESGIEGFGTQPVGTGPFRFVSYAADSELVLERNDDYDWAPESAGHDGAAYLDELRFQVITDATVRLGSLRNGDVQAIGDVPAQEVAGVEEDDTLAYHDQKQSGATFQYFFNTTRPLLADAAVRRAITAGLDIDSALLATYFGTYERATSPLSPTTAGYDETVEPVAYDPEQAAADLTEAGWIPGDDGIREKDGQRLSLSALLGSPSYDSRTELTEFLRQNLAEIGVELEINTTAQVAEVYAAGDYDIVTTSFVAVDPVILGTIYSSASYFGMAKIDALDDQLAQAEQLPPGAERDALYGEIQHAVIDEAYSIPVYVLSFRVATSTSLHGIDFDAAAYPAFYDAYLSE